MKLENDKDSMNVLHKFMELHCLPKALKIKEKVDLGETLDKFDIEFMEEIFSTIGDNRSTIKLHPECEKLALQMMQLYMAIADRMTKNEQLARSSRI